MAVRHGKLEDMTGGWFTGNFLPTMLDTAAAEVAVKHYQAGDNEGAHYHRIATEITVVIAGEVEMAGGTWKTGDIIVLEPGEITGFRSLSDSTTVVVKIPGAKDDKYEVEQ